MTARTGGLGPWGRGGISLLETEFYLQSNLDHLWCKTKLSTVRKLKCPKSHSVCHYPPRITQRSLKAIYTSKWAKSHLLLILPVLLPNAQAETQQNGLIEERILEILLPVINPLCLIYDLCFKFSETYDQSQITEIFDFCFHNRPQLPKHYSSCHSPRPVLFFYCRKLQNGSRLSSCSACKRLIH